MNPRALDCLDGNDIVFLILNLLIVDLLITLKLKFFLLKMNTLIVKLGFRHFYNLDNEL